MPFRLGLIAAVAVVSFAAAQDTRHVTEPKVPRACTKLKAQLHAVNDGLGDADEARLDTERIQKALDHCKSGTAVELEMSRGRDAFLSGPLEMREGVTLLVDKGVTLFGSRDAAVYEIKEEGSTSGLCGTIAMGAPPAVFPAPQHPAPARGGCRPLISVNNAKNVGIMGDGVIDGRGYAKILNKDYSWWQMSRKAEPKNERYFTPRMIVASHADGLVLYRITLHNSTNFHVSVNQTNGFTAWGVHLLTPTVRGTDARNTDGIDPGSSTNVTIAHSWIDNGDDNIAIKTGVSHMSVIDNHFYSGHGMSIGSETYTGQSYLLVDGLTEDHTTSGIRIKSNVTRGGSVHDLMYRNICMRDVKNPIAISPYYTNQTTEPFEDPTYKGDRIPDYKSITIQNMTSTTDGDVLIAGLNSDHITQVTLDNVRVDGIAPSQVHGHFATVTLGPGGTNIDFSGTDVKVVSPTSPKQIEPYSCEGKFVPMQ
ncbi:glycoside hydrolase family 28 protein [Edaphobacter modestus]|uniref:Type III effector polygalacturonase Pgl n=1 Tax=Edaphobacter modestus TaxID=388466 RepID=A0A4Q7YWL2_9BACT|nr:glycosyl hydrolase family 28 protein [Edaphobacter modestus]RZU41475.1 type III effector polygalacturonase Pgl precursor [Edaphobacter modestus]